MAVTGAHQQTFVENVDRRHFEVDEPGPRQRRRQTLRAFVGRDPDGGGSIGERRAIAGGQRAATAGPIEHRLELPELFHGRVTAREVVFADAVERNDQVGEETAILRRDRSLMAFERKLILFAAADAPILGHVFGMFAHAAAGDAVLHFRHKQPNVRGAKPPKNTETIRGAAGLEQAPQPNRKILPQPDLDAAHAFDAADHGQCRALSQHPARFEYADHAGAALHDGGECRHVRIEFAFEPHFARQVGVSEVDDHRAPYREVDRAGRLLRHRLNDGHRQAQGVAIGERPVDRNEGRAQAGDEPDRWSFAASH
jgi:hypothetical protein